MAEKQTLNIPKIPNSISIIAAIADNNVIGMGNDMPWHLPADLEYFKQLTTGNIVLMGRKTFQAVGKPLPQRINIVLSKKHKIDSVFTVDDIASLSDLINESVQKWGCKELFIIGGAGLFQVFLPYASKLYLTRIYHSFAGDTYFPDFDEKEWQLESKQKGLRDSLNDYDYEFIVYKKRLPFNDES